MTPQQKQSAATDGMAVHPVSLVGRKVTPSEISACGARLRAGDLVAFPTETVYGLGCHALDPSAVQKVFAAKERPLTDPLIVHVAETKDALALWKQKDENDDKDYHTTTTILQTICDAFWPGPLTLVAPAAAHVPSILMANTGYVACRCPQHALAQQLILEARVPIAAPSANKFGHVSPTRADHVMDDLGQEDVWVLEDYDDNNNNDNTNDSMGMDSKVSCQVGVESTVAKLEQIQTTEEPQQPQQYALTVLRQGAIAVQDLQECLAKAGISNVVVSSLSSRTAEENEATVAPGQTVKHYSPRIPSFLLAPSLFAAHNRQDKNEEDTKLLTQLFQQSIVLDFGGRLAAWSSVARKYRDLSPTGDSSQAAQCVFEGLRWAEQIDPEARTIVFPQVVVDDVIRKEEDSRTNAAVHDALTLALHDRLTRAASGVVLDSVESIQDLTQQQ